MDIKTEKIYMSKIINKASYQLILDDDFVVGDNKTDVDKIIREQGEIIIDEVKVNVDKIDVRGRLLINVLYMTRGNDKILSSIEENISFSENINMVGIDSQSCITLKSQLDDLTVNIINSRKISCKGLINLFVVAQQMYEDDIVVDLEEDACQKKTSQIEYTQLLSCKKDIYRVREEITLQSSKKNIEEVLYRDIRLINYSTRLLDEKISIKGDLVVFVVYSTIDGEYECLEKEIPFIGEIDYFEVKQEYIGDIEVTMGQRNVVVKQDGDGENRIIDIDVILDLNIKIYKEEVLEVLEDVYCLDKYVEKKKDLIEYVDLLVKNCISSRVNEKINMNKDYTDIMQVCNSSANIKVDQVVVQEGGLSVEGIIEANIMYISEDDEKPINSFDTIIPFVQFIDAEGINEESIYEVRPLVEQISVNMLGKDEIELKVGMCLDVIVFNKYDKDVICDLEDRPFTRDEKSEMLQMIGYRVKENDNLWDIAKKYYTTVDMLKEINNIVDKKLKTGDKLLIVRK